MLGGQLHPLSRLLRVLRQTTHAIQIPQTHPVLCDGVIACMCICSHAHILDGERVIARQSITATCISITTPELRIGMSTQAILIAVCCCCLHPQLPCLRLVLLVIAISASMAPSLCGDVALMRTLHKQLHGTRGVLSVVFQTMQTIPQIQSVLKLVFAFICTP